MLRKCSTGTAYETPARRKQTCNFSSAIFPRNLLKSASASLAVRSEKYGAPKDFYDTTTLSPHILTGYSYDRPISQHTGWRHQQQPHARSSLLSIVERRHIEPGSPAGIRETVLSFCTDVPDACERDTREHPFPRRAPAAS